MSSMSPSSHSLAWMRRGAIEAGARAAAASEKDKPAAFHAAYATFMRAYARVDTDMCAAMDWFVHLFHTRGCVDALVYTLASLVVTGDDPAVCKEADALLRDHLLLLERPMLSAVFARCWDAADDDDDAPETKRLWRRMQRIPLPGMDFFATYPYTTNVHELCDDDVPPPPPPVDKAVRLKRLFAQAKG